LAVKVGINGFGSIGRRTLRCAMAAGVQVVALNDLWDSRTLAHLFKHDSTYGTLAAKVEAREDALVVDGVAVRIFREKEPGKIPWADAQVDVVIESTGRFSDRAAFERHIVPGGAKRVIVAAPTRGVDLTCVLGVNADRYLPAKHRVLSMASCTTNCLAPVAKVLDEGLGIVSGFMSTVHSYTNDQVLLDQAHKDPRRARAGAMSIIPTSTGAAQAIGEVLPGLKGKLNGQAYRVPVPAVSLLDLSVRVARPATVETTNALFKAAEAGAMRGILATSDEELVSSDYRGDPHSAIVDCRSTMTLGDMVKVVAWYDNEWAYSLRLVELVKLLESKGI
jgi:glyceraldehyde 3-phosphate dehydrogenase